MLISLHVRPGRFLFGLMLILLLVGLASAQTRETGSISGIVTDPTDAVVLSAKVTATNTNTGATRTVTTGASGLYTIASIPPGPYTLVIEAQGFAIAKVQLSVTVGASVEHNAKLQLSKAGTEIEVSATGESVQVNTTSQSVSDTVSSRQVAELPTLTRNPYALVATAGNVSDTDPSGRGAGFAINGQRAAGTDILLDGAENVDLFTAGVGQNVPLDAVQEFSVTTNNFTAENGRASGGVVNVATKSGTNAFHGTGYEFNRVSALAANTYDNVANGFPKGTFTRNQFGYSFGGPVMKNKLFFFQSTEWTRIRSSAVQNKYIVTPDLIAASDANTQAFFAGVPSTLRAGASLGSLVTADTLQNDPDNGIGSEGAFGELAAAQPDLPVLQQVNFTVPTDAGGGLPSNRYSLVGRVDWIATDKTTLYGRYALENQDLFAGTNASSAYEGYDSGQKIRNQNMLLSLTHVFTPTIVSTTKATFNRLNNVQPLGANPVGPTLYLKAGSSAGFGSININLPGYLPESPGNAIPFGGPQNLYQFSQDLSWTFGKHQFRFGGAYIHTRDNRVFGAYQTAVEDLSSGDLATAYDNFVSGQLYDFQAAIFPQDKFPCDRDLTTGALIQTPECTLTLPVGPPRFGRNNRFNDGSLYAMDSWKVVPRLTLNLGMRWEYYGVQHGIDSKLDSNFYFGTGDTIFDRIRSGYVATTPNSPIKNLWDPNYKNFAPRVGFAYDVFGDGRTSIRGGYGISYERNFGNVTFNVIQNPPNYAVIALINGADVPTLPITPDNAGPLTGTGSKAFPGPSLRAVDPSIRPAYSEFWSLSGERELARATVLSFTYTGSRGLRLYDIANINRTGGGSVILGDARAANRLLPQYGNINFRGDNGFSNYHGFNAALRTTNFMNSGVQFNMNYTWSHAIDNLSSTFSESTNNFNLGYFDAFNPSLDKGNADFDIRQRLVISGIWDVPFAKSSQNKLVKHALGGWEFAPIFTIRSGQPYTIYDCSSSGASVVCPRYAPVSDLSRSGSPVADGPNIFNYLDIGSAGSLLGDFTDNSGRTNFAFCNGLNYTDCTYPAMLARNSFVGPKNWNFDLGIYKNFKITEQMTLQFRGELYNTFNHHNYYVVDNNADFSAASFIQVKKGGAYPGGTTQLTSTGSDERRNVQFGLKLIF